MTWRDDSAVRRHRGGEIGRMDQPMKCLRALLVAVLATTAAHANDIFVGATPLNIPGAFMPGTLPPEPPAIEGHPRGHAAWAKIPNMRQIKPHLERHEGVFHAPTSRASVSGQTATTANWSGSAVVGAANQYATAVPFMSVIVPTVHDAFGCTSNAPQQRYTAIWNGIDGFGGSTVEQAGIQIASDCTDISNGGPFIEVYPNPEVAITNFPISPGDMVDIWTWVFQSARLTCAAWENESKQNYTTTCLTAPGPFSASTVEWVVERPQIGSTLATLGNYVTVPIWSALAWDTRTGWAVDIFASAAAPPSAWGSTGTPYSISMTDNNGNVISEPNARWYDTLFMYDVGSAYCQAGASCEPRF
jgi:hypothetical protein